jgi:pyruvate/2-oxoglutarate dehydrogenase complex dihydrolipoamide acyltransferase (E2) component
MPINITMPALSPTMEEGNLSKWLVKEGDKVTSGDVIAEIETDKATMEVEAVDEGTVAKLVIPAGTEGVKVNALIAILAADGEDVAEAVKGGGAAAPKAEAGRCTCCSACSGSRCARTGTCEGRTRFRFSACSPYCQGRRRRYRRREGHRSAWPRRSARCGLRYSVGRCESNCCCGQCSRCQADVGRCRSQAV